MTVKSAPQWADRFFHSCCFPLREPVLSRQADPRFWAIVWRLEVGSRSIHDKRCTSWTCADGERHPCSRSSRGRHRQLVKRNLTAQRRSQPVAAKDKSALDDPLIQGSLAVFVGGEAKDACEVNLPSCSACLTNDVRLFPNLGIIPTLHLSLTHEFLEHGQSRIRSLHDLLLGQYSCHPCKR